MHDNSHNIIRLACHLPFNNPVYFRQGDKEWALDDAKETTLTALLKVNQNTLHNTGHLLYHETKTKAQAA